MIREQHNPAPKGDRCDCLTPVSDPMQQPWRDMFGPHQEQAALFQTVGRLAASLAHDLSNPLSGVRSVLERVARKTVQDDDERHLLSLALNQCDQMRLLLRDLQDFIAPASADSATFALDKTLDSVLRLVSKHLRICRCGVEFNRPVQPLLLHGNERRIRLLLMHLLLQCCSDLPGDGACLRIQAGVEGGKSQLILSWPIASRQQEVILQALTTHSNPSWFDAILNQHDGELQWHQRPNELTRLILSFPFPHEELR